MTLSTSEFATSEPVIRRAMPGDRGALYDVCVRTGAAGQDATGVYLHPDLLGDVFVGPYLRFQLDLAFVVDVCSRPVGYILGALDTAKFDARCEHGWWPELRVAYAGLVVPEDSADAALLRRIECPPSVPDFVVDYPSHLHVDLMPSLQGGGWGRRVMSTLWQALRDQGSRGVHLGVSRDNSNAVGFYEHLGFVEIRSDEHARWYGYSFV
ncbi:MAG: GNAT family N-acetyltransferase [Nakamurella sp.]